ncbi:unnamed protein product [Peniophora sp. CBMAI 1063]|nr:unnamed protein product [Peniophora sp. CBMAI 1063]
MSTLVIGDFSFPLDMVAGKEGLELGRTLKKLDLRYQRFCDSYNPDDTQMLDGGVDAAGDGGYTAGTGITNEELAQLQLSLHAAPQKYHKGSVTRMAKASRVKKAGPARVRRAPEDALFSAIDGTGVDGNAWGPSLSKSFTWSFPDQFGLVDSFNLDVVRPVPAPGPAAKAAIEPGSAITWPLPDTFYTQPGIYDANIDWAPLHSLTAIETQFAQSAGSSSSSGSSTSVQQQPIFNTFSGGTSLGTPAPYNMTHCPASVSGGTATSTQEWSTLPWAQEAAICDVPPSKSHGQPTERGGGGARADDKPMTSQSRVELLMNQGGLLPGQHDDWLGIVRKNSDDNHRLYRHTALEAKLPIDVRISIERLRTAARQSERSRAHGMPDPLSAYFAPSGRQDYFRCPICNDEINEFRNLLRHVESQKHLNIIFLCTYEATNTPLCQQTRSRVSGVNKHLKKDHGVKSIREWDMSRRTSAE